MSSRNIGASPGDWIKVGELDARINRFGIETRGADPPVVHYTGRKSLRVWDEPLEGAIVGVAGLFLEGAWIRIAAPRLQPDRHFRWLGVQMFRVGAVASGSGLAQSILDIALDAVPLPRLGDVRLPIVEFSSDLVGSFVAYRIQTAVWGEWAGDPGIIEEQRLYGATWTEFKVTVIGHFE
ncbi:MAG TPA: hypothetical protein VLS89_08280 [Candidatus Nanopelagicales bacterium]|nr:hypothetical protein [Candidatus Nanopelagicales bacterium]